MKIQNKKCIRIKASVYGQTFTTNQSRCFLEHKPNHPNFDETQMLIVDTNLKVIDEFMKLEQFMQRTSKGIC